MKVILNSIFVKDQDKALAFYTETWIANGNEAPQCVMTSSAGVNCTQNYDEYLDGMSWWAGSVGILILIAGSVFAVIVYEKRPIARAN